MRLIVFWVEGSGVVMRGKYRQALPGSPALPDASYPVGDLPKREGTKNRWTRGSILSTRNET